MEARYGRKIYLLVDLQHPACKTGYSDKVSATPKFMSRRPDPDWLSLQKTDKHRKNERNERQRETERERESERVRERERESESEENY